PHVNPSAPNFFEYAEDAACSGNKKTVNCTADEHIFGVAPDGSVIPFFTQDFSWSMTSLEASEIEPTAFAFDSQDGPDTATPNNGVRSITFPVTDRTTCLEVISEMQALLAQAGVTLTKVRVTTDVCPTS